MILLVMADLEMLVLDKTKFDTYDDAFFDRFLTVVSSYDVWVRESDAKWLFSNELLDLLTASFPWKSKSPKLNNLRRRFFQWIQHAQADKIIQFVSFEDPKPIKLIPNIHADYASRDYPELDNEWRNVLARNIDIERSQTLIFSFGEKPDRIVLLDMNNDESQRFPIIKDHQGWESALSDAYDWDIPEDIYQQNVAVSDVKRNIGCIGGTFVRTRGDHFIYEFEGARSWPLTLRDPVPISHLKQLVSITGYPMNVIQISESEYPPRKIQGK
ncbi:hypothetical protein QUF72_18305 [Desulfobacterales bacterium HSG2]|nr:hypothetical protein [Desulfobacterales bacterium HSG2]